MSQYDNSTKLNIPLHLASWQGLCWGAKGVYGSLKHWCEPAGTCVISIDTIANTAGLGYDQTHKHLKTLVAAGLVGIQHRYKETNCYTLLPSPILDGEYPPLGRTRVRSSLGRTKVRTLGSGLDRTRVRSNKEKTPSYSSPSEEKANKVEVILPLNMTLFEMESVTLYLADIERIRLECLQRRNGFH